MRKLICFFILYLLSSSIIYSQNAYHPWTVTGGANFADFNFPKNTFSEPFFGDNLMGLKAPSMVKIGRNINSYLNASLLLSTTQLNANSLNEIPLQENVSGNNLYKIGLEAAFRFANGKLLKESFFIDPYLYTGFSLSRINSKFYGGVPVGIGLNIWPLKYFGLIVQGSYEYLFSFDNYMHYSVGVVVRFGDMKDKDKDRIPDRYDTCPKIFGLEKNEGCPDYDYDGVVDSIDQCPREYGYAPSGGCPDFDKDGVPDKIDLCPCQPGSKENQGCPSNVQYSKPTEEMPVIIQPQVKEEKIAVSHQIVPQEIEVSERPVEQLVFEDKKPSPAPNPIIVPVTDTELINETISKHLDFIRFKSNSATLLSVSFQSLDEILNILKQNQDKHFIVVGYTDDSGLTEYNRFLSMERAKAVIKYFVEKRFNTENVEPRGFGNTNPADNKGSLNRRVEIYTK